MSKTVAYLRVSTDKQADEGHGLAAQQAACAAWAVNQGVEIAEFFTDVASGARSDRPEMGRLKDSVKMGFTKRILVYSVDRLGRDLVDTETTIRDFEKAGCEVVSITQFFDANPAGKMLRQMLLVFAEFERSLIKARMASGRKAAKAKGRWLGGIAPLGTRSVGNGVLETVEVEAALVSRILALHTQSHSLREISVILAEEGSLAKAGVPYHPSSIAKILKRREFYQSRA